MSNIVKELHELGRSDAWISQHLGMDKDEILRLKQITALRRCSATSNSAARGGRPTRRTKARILPKRRRPRKARRRRRPSLCERGSHDGLIAQKGRYYQLYTGGAAGA